MLPVGAPVYPPRAWCASELSTLHVLPMEGRPLPQPHRRMPRRSACTGGVVLQRRHGRRHASAPLSPSSPPAPLLWGSDQWRLPLCRSTRRPQRPTGQPTPPPARPACATAWLYPPPTNAPIHVRPRRSLPRTTTRCHGTPSTAHHQRGTPTQVARPRRHQKKGVGQNNRLRPRLPRSPER